MTKPRKTPFANLKKPTDAELFAATKPVPFKRCVCGNSIISSATKCPECLRLYELGMKTPPVPRFAQANDTQKRQSYPAFTHKGYQDNIPTGKFPASRKERV